MSLLPTLLLVAAGTSTASAAPAAVIEPSLEDLGLDQSLGESDGPSLSLYGFIDFGYTKTFAEKRSIISDLVRRDSFAVGSFNLYLNSNLSDHWRSLAEVQFLYAPNGTDTINFDTGQVDTIRTSYFNILEFALDEKWGGVRIQRAWLEYEISPLLTIRAGQWLTPVGIWNVDHGSPTIIGVKAPYMLKLAFFPTQQTGITAPGEAVFGEVTIGYELTVSNGRGPFDSFRDLDGNKGLGGRATARVDTLGQLTLGASAYYGRFTDANLTLGVDNSQGSTSVALENQVTMQFDELCLGADLRWEWEGLLVIGEVMVNQRRYTDEGRPSLGSGLIGLRPDHTRAGAYGLLGYRADWLGMMPFVMIDGIDMGSPDTISNAIVPSVGVNFRPHPAVVIKLQLSRAYFHIVNGLGESDDAFNSFDTQAAWAF